MTSDDWSQFGGPPPRSRVHSTSAATPEVPYGVDDPWHRDGVEDFEPPARDSATAHAQETVPIPIDPLDTRPANHEDGGVARPAPDPHALRAVEEAIAGLRIDVQQVATVAKQQHGLVDKLHAENERLRRAEMERLRDPLVRDLIGLRDTCLRNARGWSGREDGSGGPVATALHDVADEVMLILQRQGVDSFEPATGTPYDRREQRAARSQLTADPAAADAVAEVLRPGYRIGDRVVRHADVVVWRYSADATVDPETSSGEPALADGHS